MGFLDWLFGTEKTENRPKGKRIRIIDPENISNKINSKGQLLSSAQCENFHKLKCWYGPNDLDTHIKGRKVKYWKIVDSAYDGANDKYIPIFYKKKKTT